VTGLWQGRRGEFEGGWGALQCWHDGMQYDERGALQYIRKCQSEGGAILLLQVARCSMRDFKKREGGYSCTTSKLARVACDEMLCIVAAQRVNWHTRVACNEMLCIVLRRRCTVLGMNYTGKGGVSQA